MEQVITKELESRERIKRLTKSYPFLRFHFWGNELWKYQFSLIYILLAFYISKLLDFLTRVWLKRWTSKTKSELDGLMLDLLNGPVKVISFVIFLRIGLDVFQWPPLVETILSKSFIVIVGATITYSVIKRWIC